MFCVVKLPPRSNFRIRSSLQSGLWCLSQLIPIPTTSPRLVHGMWAPSLPSAPMSSGQAPPPPLHLHSTGSLVLPGKTQRLYHWLLCGGRTQRHKVHACTYLPPRPGIDIIPSPSSPPERNPTLLPKASNSAITGMAMISKGCRKTKYGPS